MFTASGRVTATSFFGLFIGVAIIAAACGGAHQSLPLVPVGEALTVRGLGPLSTVTVNVVVTVPSSQTAKSISISVNGAAPVIANITSSSPGCHGTNPVVCTIAVSAPTQKDLFAFETFSEKGGLGSVLASGNVFQKISPTSAAVHIILAGTPGAI